MSVVAVAAFGDEALRPAPAGGEQRVDVGAFEFADALAVGGAAQFDDRRLIDARPCVDEEALDPATNPTCACRRLR